MTISGTTTPDERKNRSARHTRRPRTVAQPDGPLQLATNQLHDAIHALCNPQPHHHQGRIVWLNSRYVELAGAISGQRGGRGHSQPSSVIPLFIDALLLKMAIDSRTAEWDTDADTPTRLTRVSHHPFRPQDTEYMATITTEIQCWVRKIDDLFAPKLVYLYDPDQPGKWATCPRCGHNEAFRYADDGQRVRTPALAVTPAGEAFCQHCHDRFESLGYLGRLLGYQEPEGLTV